MSSSGAAFRQTRIPNELGEEVVRLLRENPFLGYRTLADFVRAATAEKLRSVHVQVALRALWTTTSLGAEAVEAALLDTLPEEYRGIIEDERQRLP